MIAPIYDNWAAEARFSSVKFVKIDIDEIGSLVQEYGVRGFPTFIAFENGEPFDTVVGANVPQIEKMIVRLHEH